jgi:hypothetical protein
MITDLVSFLVVVAPPVIVAATTKRRQKAAEQSLSLYELREQLAERVRQLEQEGHEQAYALETIRSKGIPSVFGLITSQRKGYEYEPQTLPGVPPVLQPCIEQAAAKTKHKQEEPNSMFDWLKKKLEEPDHRAYDYDPPARHTSPGTFKKEWVLNYPAQPEPEPEPSPLAVINRYWNHNGTQNRLKEPPRPPRVRERPMKLPAQGNYLEEPTPPRENERHDFARPAEPIDWTTYQPPSEDECVRHVADADKLPGFGWATPEQADWMQELKRQLIRRGEAECQAGYVEWRFEAYREKFGELELLIWNAVRTGMSMFDFTAMLQWERENGIGRGLFDSGGGAFDYRGVRPL